MDILSLTFKGSALDHPEKLAEAQKILQEIKKVKLETRHDRHSGKVYSFTSLILHLKEELAEFQCAVADETTEGTLEELADMSNMIDILASTIIGGE